MGSTSAVSRFGDGLYKCS